MTTAAEWTDIGHGVAIEVRSIAGVALGVAYTHPTPTGTRCEGWVPFGAGGWTVGSLTPLTLSPSLLCRVCAHHGFIREGVWVPA
jgi:hypothetical protein